MSVIERTNAAEDRLAAQEHFDTALSLEDTDVEAALQAYEHAIDADPALLDAYINLGRLLHDRKHLARAESVYREGIRACGNDPVLLYNLGVLLDDTERAPEAIEAYEAALRADPAMADCHYNLALLCERLGRSKDAIRHMARYRVLTGNGAK